MAVCAPTCGCAIQTETLALSGSGSAEDPWVINQANDPAIADLQAQIDTINAALTDDYIPYADFNAKGDLLVGTADDEGGRLAAASFGRVLISDPAGSGVKWNGGVVEIQTITTNGDPSTFSNIPQEFTHLKIVGATRHSNTDGLGGYSVLSVNFNGDISAGAYRWLFRWDDPSGDGRSSSDSSNVGVFGQIGAAGWQPFEVIIPWYALTSSIKHYMGSSFGSRASTGGTAGFRVTHGGGLWVPPSSTGVTSIELRAGGANNLDGGRVTLLGIG